MTTPHPPSPQYRNGLLAIALVVLFAIAAVVLTRPQTSATTLSPVSGLMAMKASAQSAMPYDVAMANQKPTLIEFYADWCTTCQGLAPTVASIHDEFESELNVVMLNVDDPQWRSQIQRFQVSGVPHLALLTADHRVADTVVGNVPKAALRDRVANILDSSH